MSSTDVPGDPSSGQAALDRQYDTRIAVPDADRYTERRADASRVARRTFLGRLDVPYGPAPEQLLDVFPAGDDKAPVVIYVHGGQWRYRSKADVSFLAATLVPAGVAVVAPGFTLAPAASLEAMVSQVTEAVKWTYEHAESFGADRDRLHIAGHSSGAHLAAMVLAAPWAAWGLPDDTIKGSCLTSGLYDLEPVRHTSMNAWLRLDATMAARLSPVRHLPSVAGTLTIAVGDQETSEFRRQTRDYSEAWRDAGHPVRVVPMPGHNHYSLMLELGEASSPLLATVLSEVLGPSGDGRPRT